MKEIYVQQLTNGKSETIDGTAVFYNLESAYEYLPSGVFVSTERAIIAAAQGKEIWMFTAYHNDVRHDSFLIAHSKEQ